MTHMPETRFARAVGGTNVAYQVRGEGPVDLLVIRPAVFPVDLMGDEPRLVHFLDRLSTFSRHVWFDPRGTGASDRITHREGRLVESIVDDMLAVLDAVGFERAVLLSLAMPAALLFAATHPERTKALVICDTTARARIAPDYPHGITDDRLARQLEATASPGFAEGIVPLAPSLGHDARFRRWYERAARLMSPPNDRGWRSRNAMDIDVRDVLETIRVPTLVVTHTERAAAAQTLYLADRIAGAKSVEFSGCDHLPFADDSLTVLDAVEEFLTGRLAPSRTDRVLATVLFTDIVNSTGQAARMGDRRWRELLAAHDALVREQVDRFRGRTVASTGDGVLATFDGPARAIGCACSIRDAVHALDLQVRAGLHTGEIELHHNNIAGIAVHIGQRVCSLAGPDQVVVSRTVADLLTGSDITFQDHGEHELKGVPGTWRAFNVQT